MNAVASEKPFCDKAENLTVGGDAHDVEKRILKHQWQADGDDHALDLWYQFFQDSERRALDSGRMKGIFAAITGDTELGQAQNGGSLRSRLPKSIDNA